MFPPHFSFWVALATLLFSLGFAWSKRWKGHGLPALAVLLTIGVWYFADVFYNDYSRYLLVIGEDSLSEAWWQVFLFLLSFILLLGPVTHMFTRRFPHSRSSICGFAQADTLNSPQVQHMLDKSAKVILIAFLAISAIALVKVKGDFISIFAPYIYRRSYPWGRGQIGGSFLEAFNSLFYYLQMFIVGAAGIIAALSNNKKTRRTAIFICILSFPNYIFNRTRHTMLTTVLPGLLAWIFLRLKGGIAMKALALVVSIFAIEYWFAAVMANRYGMRFDVQGALSFSRDDEEQYHLGLNMFEELAWIDLALETNYLEINYGRRYFAELVNPIPRALWKNKPTIGLEYAKARGQGVVSDKGEVASTKSTGMIGQGVVNFGTFFGPIFAAFLMTMWCGMLARLDVAGPDPARLLLYLVGITITFNLGRDITLLVLYPFLFGSLIFYFLKVFRKVPQSMHSEAPTTGLPSVR